jgi:hypothetical protein
LRFAEISDNDQLVSIGLDGKGSLNRLASTDPSKNPELIAKERFGFFD